MAQQPWGRSRLSFERNMGCGQSSRVADDGSALRAEVDRLQAEIKELRKAAKPSDYHQRCIAECAFHMRQSSLLAWR